MFINKDVSNKDYKEVTSIEELKVGDIGEIKIDLLGTFKAIVYSIEDNKCHLMFMESIGELPADVKGSGQFKHLFKDTRLHSFVSSIGVLTPKLMGKYFTDYRIPKPDDLMEIFTLEEVKPYKNKFLEDNRGMWVEGIGSVSCNTDLFVLTLEGEVDEYTLTPSQLYRKVVPIITIKA